MQVLKKELDGSQERLQKLQDDIALLAKQEGPLGIQSSSELESSVETLFDRWDALNQIIEIQAHRVCQNILKFKKYLLNLIIIFLDYIIWI